MDFLLNRKLTRTETQYQNNISNICRISELPMYSKKNNGRFFLQYNEITLLSKFLWSKILIQKIFDLAVRVVCYELKITKPELNWNDFSSGSGFG